MRFGSLLTSALGLAVVLSSPRLRAETQRGAVELTLAATLISYSKLAFTMQLPRPIGDTDGTIANTAWAPSINPVTLEIGYGVSSLVNLGLLLEYGQYQINMKVPRAEYDTLQSDARFLVGPRLELIFSDSGKVRPFVMTVAGFTASPKQEVEGAISLTGFELLAGLGLHWFLTDTFSIDPAARVGYGIGSGSLDFTAGETTFKDVPVTGSLLSAAFLLGFSGWI